MCVAVTADILKASRWSGAGSLDSGAEDARSLTEHFSGIDTAVLSLVGRTNDDIDELNVNQQNRLTSARTLLHLCLLLFYCYIDNHQGSSPRCELLVVVLNEPKQRHFATK